MPTWLAAFLILVGSLAGMGLVILTIISIATVEGFASLVFMVLNVLVFIVWPLRLKKKANLNGALGVAFIFMAFMGAGIDQTGNPVYNKPIEWCMCGENEELTRATQVSHSNARTSYAQDYRCRETPEEEGRSISIFAILGLRFVEYMLLILLLVLIQRQIWAWGFGNGE